MGVDDYADKAEDRADEQGGGEGLKEKADRLKDIAGGEGDPKDKAREAMGEFRGGDGDSEDDDPKDTDR